VGLGRGVRLALAVLTAVMVVPLSAIPEVDVAAAAPACAAPAPNGSRPAVSGGFHSMTPTRVLDSRRTAGDGARHPDVTTSEAVTHRGEKCPAA